jgi:predicted MFS family arabinose efflux permease
VPLQLARPNLLSWDWFPPLLTALTGRFPRKQLLVALMMLFTAGNILAWQAPARVALG